jgi:uncharacterized protein
VEPQTLWVQVDDPDRPYRFAPTALERLRGFRQTKLVHGVGFPVGGSRRPDPRHIPLLRQAIEELRSPWASEHLSFNEVSDQASRNVYTTSFLLPPRQTPAGARTAARAIRSVAARLPVPFAVETGVNYLRPRADELDDGTFVAQVVDAADCGILLDLHNIWINERNGRQPVTDLLEELPLERIWEIHLAGGFELDGYLIDAHSGEIPEELLELAQHVVPQLPNLHSINFELLPDFFAKFGLDGVRRQLRRMWELWDRRGTRLRAARPRLKSSASVTGVGPTADPVDPRDWETALGRLVVGTEPQSQLEAELARDPGVGLLQSLVARFRSGRLVSALPLTTRLLLLTSGGERFRELLASFWDVRPPELFASAEAEEFAAFLLSEEQEIACLEDVVALDLATIELQRGGTPSELVLAHDPIALVDALERGQLPVAVATGTVRVRVAASTGGISR